MVNFPESHRVNGNLFRTRKTFKTGEKKVIKELENRAKNPSSRVSYLIVKRKEKYTPYSQQTQ